MITGCPTPRKDRGARDAAAMRRRSASELTAGMTLREKSRMSHGSSARDLSAELC
jgi:hypothetical protein